MKKTTRTLVLASVLGGGVLAVALFPRAQRQRNTEFSAVRTANAPADATQVSQPNGAATLPIEAPAAGQDAPAIARMADIATSPPQPVGEEGRKLFASLADIAKESHVSLPLPGGGSMAGKVAYVHHHPNGAVTMGGTLDDGSGTFELAREPQGFRGFILQPTARISHEYSSDAAGNLQVVRGPSSRIICDTMPPPKEEAAAKPGGAAAAGAEEIAIFNGGESVGMTYEPIPVLSSRPLAAATIYLDLDGQVVEGSSWNGGARIVAPAYNIDVATATDMWRRVSEDYASFDVNVTTDLQAYLKAPQGKRVRCIVASDGPSISSAGGVAFVGSFAWSGDPVCWNYYTGKSGAEVIAHEAGHTLGLSHDGTSTEGYYGGYGSGETGWAPIMGVGYYKELTQWSKGDYPDANQHQDDLSIIAGYTGVRVDDHSALTAEATPLLISAAGAVTNAGVIQTRTDVDTFVFTTGGGSTTLNFNRAPNGPNLDIEAKLYDSAGTLVTSANPADDLDATITAVLAAGTYTVTVDGVGKADWNTSGYDDYASLGQYTITGTVASPGWRFRIPVSALAGAPVGTVAPGTGSSYSITGGNSGSAFAINSAGNLTVSSQAALASQQLFSLTISYTVGGSPVTSTVPVSIAPDRGLKRELYTGISGNTVANLTANASYPNSPASTGVVEIFEAPSNAAENYGQRVSGYILPPTTGSYQFWIASDDYSELWLSTDANPANKVKIAYLNGATTSRNWTANATQASASIALVAGQRYYVEALHKEGAGGDNLAVAWQGPGIAQAVIGSEYLVYPGARPNRAPLLASSTFRVSEAAATGTTVGTLISGDPDAGSALTFAITGGNTGNAFALNASTGVLTVNAALDFASQHEYNLTIQATDPGSLTATAEILVEVIAPAIKREVYTGISGLTVANLTSAAAYPNSPNTVEYRQVFEGPADSADNYGQRLSGYLRAPDSGSYSFWIAGDDATELWLSTDANPANKVKIAYNTDWTGSRQWTKYASQKSANITLEGGKFYYIEALMKEGTGGDNLAVSWSGPGFGQIMLGAPFVTQETYNHGAPVLNDKTVNASDLNGTITTLEAKDWSDPGTTITYAITAGNGAGYFAINASTGVITSTLSPVPVGSYVLTVSATDNGPTPLSDTGNVTLNIFRSVLKREIWTGLDGGTIAELTGSAAYAGAPNVTDYVAAAEYTSYGDSYGARTSGWFTAPASGSYFFYVASDDASELWISTNGNPANKVLRSSVSGYTNPKAWTAQASQKSAAVTLTAGTSYYLETLHKEGGGGDHLAIGWQSTSGGAITDLPAANLTVTRPNQAPLAVNDSASTNEGNTVTVSVLSNDSDPDVWPSALTITNIGTPTNGTAVQSGSSIVYTPVVGYYGVATFSYTIGDGAATSTATVTVTVNDTSSAHDLTGVGLTRTNLGGASGLSRVLAGGDWEVKSTGVGLTSTSDSGAYESAAQAGHFDVVLQLKSLTGPSGSRSGLMLREGTGNSARFVAAGITGSGSFYYSSRTTSGGSVSETVLGTPVPSLPNAWVMLRRAGDKVRVHISTDGAAFQEISVITVTGLTASLQTGPFAASGSSGASARAVFGGYDVPFVLPASAFAWWELDENTGTTTYDAFGARNMTLTNSPAWTTTPRNYGLSFDGTDDYLNLASTDVSGNWSAAMWVKRTGSKSTSALIASGSYCLKLEQSGTGKTGITRFGVADYTFNYSSPLNTWVHLVFVGTSTQTKLYVNGTLTDTLAVGISLPMQNVGRRPTNQDLLQAQIDDLILFSGALSDAEVSSVYQEMGQ